MLRGLFSKMKNPHSLEEFAAHIVKKQFSRKEKNRFVALLMRKFKVA